MLTCMPQACDAPELARTLRCRGELADQQGNNGLAATLRLGADMIDHLYDLAVRDDSAIEEIEL